MRLTRDIPKLAALLSLLAIASAAGRSAAQDATESTESYVKIRVDVELRGTLHCTPAGSTVTAVWRNYELYHDDRELPGQGPETWKLDFRRARRWEAMAKALDGKEAVVVGRSELRMVSPRLPPGAGGGFSGQNPPPSPTWSVHHTILVSELRLADKPSTARQSSDKAKAIVDRLRPDLATLALYLTYVPAGREERPSLELYAPIIVVHPGGDRFHITAGQCRNLFDILVADGYFARATPMLAVKKSSPPQKGPFYDLRISVGGQSPMYHASIGWDRNTIERLQAIQARLDGQPAKAVGRLIAAVSSDLAEHSKPLRNP